MLALVAAALLSADAGTASPARPAQAAPSAGEHPSGGQDFTPEAKLLFRVVACQGDEPLPANIDAQVVEEHCKKLNSRIEKYRKTWVEVAQPFIQKLKPPGLPTTVVYPFGGGDLISALNTYPELTEVTTMSLEHAGDPRRIHKIDAKQLKDSLDVIDRTSAGLLVANDSKTENLMKGQRGDLPGQLSFFLIALAVHGYEPVSLRYVKVKEDGTLKGQTAEDITAVEGKEAKLLRAGWTAPDFSTAFDNCELTFVKKGSDPKKDLKVHRHFAMNLSDDQKMSPDDPPPFGQDHAMQKHLNAKGSIVAMTKAASYLLWRDNFSTIRNFLLDHMVFMVSDSTGIPPVFAKKAGFEQIPFGHFTASFLGANPQYNEDFKKLWKNAQPLEFRYGYLDKGMQFHMLITRKAETKKE